jgi:type IV fimbrial biogenesis protein FimT
MLKKPQGFTLYELLITTFLVSILAGLAIPSFADLLARQRQRTEIDALFHAVHLARKESIMRRKVVSLCPSIDGRACTPSRDWSSGWLMFENRDRDSPPRVDADEPVLLTHTTPRQVRIVANRQGFTFRATFLRATNGTIVVCEPKTRIIPKALVISYTGRPRVARHSPDGELYSCAD